VEGGQYGALFDHAEDDLAIADFQVFEFAKVQDGVNHPYLEALLTLLIYRDTQTLMNPALRGRLKHITFDECAAHWRHPRLAEYIKNILKMFQRYNGSLSLVTQSPEDYGLLEPFVLQNCTSFVFFPNPKISEEVLRRFGFDDARIEVFRELKPREFLLHGTRGTAGDLWKVLRLTVDPYRYWMCTTSPNDAVLREKVFAELGPEEGLKKLAAGGAA
jgi:type IV secretory pathway VirB4 component